MIAQAKATYLYCLVRSRAAPERRGAPRGLPGTGRLRLLDAGRGLWLLCADAPLTRYGEAPIEQGLKDLAWVSACAMAHEAVVERFRKSGGVLPFKLFTLFAGDDRALQHVARIRPRIERVLRRVAGREEWGVRLHAVRAGKADATRVGRADDPRAPKGGAKERKRAPASGTAFLLERKAAREAALRAGDEAREAAARIFRALEREADDAVVRPPPQGEIGRRVLLDAVFLVPEKRAARFRAAVRETAKKNSAGGGLTLTGPWPPYHFVGEAR